MFRGMFAVFALSALLLMCSCQTTAAKSSHQGDSYSFANYKNAMEKKAQKVKSKTNAKNKTKLASTGKNKKAKKLIASHKKNKKLIADTNQDEGDDSFSLYDKKTVDKSLVRTGQEERYAATFEE